MDNKKKKIVHILYTFRYGGLEFVLVNMINSMPSNKYQHVIVSLREYAPDMLLNLKENVEVHTVNKQLGKDFGSYFRLRKLIKTLKPDVIHTYNIGTIDSVVSCLFCGAKAFVHSEHGRDASDPLGINRKYNFLRKILSPIFDRFVVVSNELKEWLINEVHIPAGKITRIYNGVDVDQYRHANNISEKKSKLFGFDGFLIGTVGRLDPVKNHSFLIDAFNLYKREHPDANVRLVIVGDGATRKKLEDRINRYGMQSDIILTGSRSDISDIMSVLDLYVQSSVAEGVPMTILEAMSTEVPVISTSVGGIPEIIDHDVNGYLVESNDVVSMADAIAYLLDDPVRLKKYGENARRKIVENYSLKEMGNQYLEMYNQVLK